MSICKIYDNSFNITSLLHLPFKEDADINVLQDLNTINSIELLKALVYENSNQFMEPCIAHTICLNSYSNNNEHMIYWEPHHDGKESRWISLVFIDVDKSKWVGGQLDIYSSLDSFEFPNNKERIDPKPGRVVIFESSNVHCIRPYFGSVPRKTLSIGWA